MGILDRIVSENFYKANGTRELNKMNFKGCLDLLITMYLFFAIQYLVKGYVIEHFLLFTIVNAILHGIVTYVYLKNPASERYKSLLMMAFFVTYTWLLFSYQNDFTCLLICPPLVMIILYHDIKFSVINGISAILINIIYTAYRIVVIHDGNVSELGSFSQILMITLLVIATINATMFYTDSYQKNAAYIDLILDQSGQLVDRTEQSIIETLSNAIDAKDQYTEGHSIRVAEYSVEIAKKMGITGIDLKLIKYSALLHDVGKISIKDDVLNKNAKLSEDEYKEMQKHTASGGDILSSIPTMPNIADGALYHHEKYDGTGYPNGLSGENIPLAARIIALADAYDAITSDRVYRKRLEEEEALKEIKEMAGTQFDPKVVDAFCEFIGELS